ncbi:hypothetical protein [Shimia abyssi]|nr:hypothetical protein [Shimia abyssi]
MLALSDGHRQSRKWLQAQLWSESEGPQGASSLRQELARLKRILGTAIQSDKIDIWLEGNRFEFDHLSGLAQPPHEDLLQGLDIADDAFDDWLREQRQYFANRPEATADFAPPTRPPQPGLLLAPAANPVQATHCTVVFDRQDKGNPVASVASLILSERLHQKLDQYGIFRCLGVDEAPAIGSNGPITPSENTVVVRIVSIAQSDDIYLGVQMDSGVLGRRFWLKSAVVPADITRIHVAPEIGRMVGQVVENLLDGLAFGGLPVGSTAEALILANEAKKLTFRLDRESLSKADQYLTRAYELEPRGEFLAWRGFLRNTAFFQHRNDDIFADPVSSEELSLEALRQAPENGIVQAFSSQLDYVNQGSTVEPMIKAQRAVEIDPSDPLARALLSNSLTFNGHLTEGYAVAQQAIDLAKGGAYEFYFHHFAAMAATALRNYDTALRHARSSVAFVPEFVSPRRYEVVLAHQLGDQSGVDIAVSAMRRVEPDFRVKTMLEPSYPVNTLRRLPIIEAIQ